MKRLALAVLATVSLAACAHEAPYNGPISDGQFSSEKPSTDLGINRPSNCAPNTLCDWRDDLENWMNGDPSCYSPNSCDIVEDGLIPGNQSSDEGSDNSSDEGSDESSDESSDEGSEESSEESEDPVSSKGQTNASANNGKGGNYSHTGHTDNGKGQGKGRKTKD
jgi:hypothetical protein